MGKPLFQRLLFPNQPHHMVGYAGELAARMPVRGKILDLGCGANTTLARFRTPDREVWGVDFQEHPQLAHPGYFRLLGAAGEIPFADNTFDLVHSMWVMEHVADPQAYLREIRRVLVPGGHFVGHTISGNHYVTWISRAVGMLPHKVTQGIVRMLYGRAHHDTFPTWYRMNTQRSLRRHGSDSGMSLVGLHRYADAGYFDFLGPLRNVAVLCDWLLGAVSPGWGQIYLTATLRKLPGESGEAGQTRAVA